MNPPMDYSEAPTKGAVSDLVRLARDAFQEKRLRNSLTLIAAILKIDPQNKDAHTIQSWVNADLEQEFQQALRLAEEARRKASPAIWGGVQTSVRRILNVLPDHDGAKTLLAEALVSSQLPGAATRDSERPEPSFAPPLPFEQTFIERKPRWRIAAAGGLLVLVLVGSGYLVYNRFRPVILETVRGIGMHVDTPSQGVLAVRIDDGVQLFVDGEYRGTAPLEPLKLRVGKHQLSYKSNGTLIAQEEVEVSTTGVASNTLDKIVGRVDLLVLPATGVELTVDNAKFGPAPPFLLLKPGSHQLSFKADDRSTEVRNVVVAAGERNLVPVVLQTAAADVPKNPASPPPVSTKQAAAPPPAVPANRAAPPSPPPPAPVAAPGKLTITSSAPVQIYADGRLLGSTPATLEFPAGDQTLEYRSDNLAQKMTHSVKSGETARVNVEFDTTVQINAQPWAEVFLQDGKNTSLGQTPLSGVRVPVGSTLVFRNPRFPDKTYRVTGKNATIAVAFP